MSSTTTAVIGTTTANILPPECAVILHHTGNITTSIKTNIRSWQAILIMLIFGLFFVFLAKIFEIMRKKVYRDKDNLDRAFDAGGKVTVGLTATTIVSQWTWAATLLQSSGTAVKYGISGPFWYAAGATIQLFLFAMISVELKIRAPGAKTFLQVVRARFGKPAHVTYCVYALMTNVIVTSMLMLGGTAVLTSLVEDLTVEFSSGLLCAVIGSYAFIGGLGGVFYVSYFNTLLMILIIIIFLMRVYHYPTSSNEMDSLGSIDKVHQLLSCSVGPSGNYGNSYLTLYSTEGFMFGIVNIIGNFGTVFVDQSYWQCSVAAKPRQGVWGFLTGGLVWFSIPFTFATTMGLAYICLSTAQGTPLLESAKVSDGLAPPAVAQALMGLTGELLMIILLVMAIVSTASAEIMAVVSVIVYDVYAIYLKPYRRTQDENTCLLCGKSRGRMANPLDKCECESMTFCPACAEDEKDRTNTKRALKPPFKCRAHGPYRTYNENLMGLKDWGIVTVTILIVPLTIILKLLQISLNWLYSFMGVLIGSAVVPLCLCMRWDRLTGKGMIAGAVSGTVCALIAWLVHASQQPGGLQFSNFMENTGKMEVMLTGNCVSIFMSMIVTVVVSLVVREQRMFSSGEDVWENTRDIDNPLSPWTETYATDLRLTTAHRLDARPSLDDVSRAFRSSRYTAIIGSLLLTVTVIIVWPAGMLSIKTLSLSQFSGWIYVADIWIYCAAIFVILVPVVNEIKDIHETIRKNRVMDSSNVIDYHFQHGRQPTNK